MDIKNDPEFASLTLLVYLDDITIMGPAALALRAAGRLKGLQGSS